MQDVERPGQSEMHQHKVQEGRRRAIRGNQDQAYGQGQPIFEHGNYRENDGHYGDETQMIAVERTPAPDRVERSRPEKIADKEICPDKYETTREEVEDSHRRHPRRDVLGVGRQVMCGQQAGNKQSVLAGDRKAAKKLDGREKQRGPKNPRAELKADARNSEAFDTFNAAPNNDTAVLGRVCHAVQNERKDHRRERRGNNGGKPSPGVKASRQKPAGHLRIGKKNKSKHRQTERRQKAGKPGGHEERPGIRAAIVEHPRNGLADAQDATLRRYGRQIVRR